jgi:hypothetical protein
MRLPALVASQVSGHPRISRNEDFLRQVTKSKYCFISPSFLIDLALSIDDMTQLTSIASPQNSVSRLIAFRNPALLYLTVSDQLTVTPAASTVPILPIALLINRGSNQTGKTRLAARYARAIPETPR